MEKEEKIKFVVQLTGSIRETVIDAIADNKIPANWDGIELRWYLAELFERSARFGDKRRKKEYNNTVIVNDL
jgi:hypothetical protein